MNLQLKSLAGGLTDEQKKYIRKSTLWMEKHVPNNANLTVGVREKITKKSNQAFEIILHLQIPNIKKAFYTSVSGNTFTESIDTAKGKLERLILKQKARRFPVLRFKMPKIKLKIRKNKNEPTE